MVRDQLQDVSWEPFMEGKEACTFLYLLKNSILETQEQSIPNKRKEEFRTKDHPGLTVGFWMYLKAEKKHTSYRPAEDLLRTTRTFLEHIEMQ